MVRVFQLKPIKISVVQQCYSYQSAVIQHSRRNSIAWTAYLTTLTGLTFIEDYRKLCKI